MGRIDQNAPFGDNPFLNENLVTIAPGLSLGPSPGPTLVQVMIKDLIHKRLHCALLKV